MPVIYRQTLSVVAGKKPDITNAPIKEKDFEIPLSELLEVSTWGESTSHRFKVADGSVDLPLMQGSTISSGEVFVVRTDTAGVELDLEIVNVNGTTVNTPIMAGRTSMPENFV